jgi:predicted nicotinamide N-methyase
LIQILASDACANSRPSLDSLGELRVDRVDLPGTSHSFQIARPIDYDRLIDEAAADPEQNLPYWAEIWPSGVALAARIARTPEIVRGKRVLELGCGLGVTAVAALRAGADLLVIDYAPEALALCAHNTRDQAGREPRLLRINWRDVEQARAALREETFPVVLAADVLYERRDIEPLLALTERVVAPGGDLWLAEPNRVPALLVVETLKTRGWAYETERCDGPWPDPEDNRKGIVVSIHRLRRPALL